MKGWNIVADSYVLRDQLRKMQEEQPLREYLFYTPHIFVHDGWCGFYQPKVKMYQVTSELGNHISSWSTEVQAIADAESLAKRNPGQVYYVTKRLTKSVVVAPSITTRL